ncbi:MAG: hypothetical protein J1E43_01395 [Christensenellaceae bacterium]|nr:hypothetical protein [Christensenellaceae bacterium]
MPQDIYSVAALACRYWFAFLGVLIVWRSFSWLRKDRRLKHKRLKTLPDAGMIGELVVLQGSDSLPEDSFLPVPREGVLGYLRTCDVVVPIDGVARQHLDFVFIDGQGLVVTPRRGCSCMVDGELIADRRDARAFPMRHNSLLSVGDAMLKLRLFAGLDAPYAMDYMPDLPEQEPPQEEAMPGYAPPYNGAPYPPQETYFPPQDAWPEPPAYPPAPQQPINRRYHDEA